MSSNFRLFKRQLDDSLELVDAALGSGGRESFELPESIDAFPATQSLLARCEGVCKKHEKGKPTIRIIHHLACSGGTLISKCISAMPNVYLLSEVHPFTDLAIGKDKPKYAPSDIASLARYAGIPKQKELAGKLFKNSIDEVYEHVSRYGGALVLRDHTHADFNTNELIPERSALIQLLEDSYNIKSILTIRNPIDSYASLVKNGWVHFDPKTFDEYCRRFLLLIKQFKKEQIFRYEDFLHAPKIEMQAMAEVLALVFDGAFEDVFGIFKITGDSGRTSDVISHRKRIAPEDIVKESESSTAYREICGLCFY